MLDNLTLRIVKEPASINVEDDPVHVPIGTESVESRRDIVLVPELYEGHQPVQTKSRRAEQIPRNTRLGGEERKG